MNRAALVLLALLCACSPDRSGLERRAIAPAKESGWARLPLDGAAQRRMDGLWLGDRAGHSVPYLLERDGLWEPRRLEPAKVLLGTDPASSGPAAEFELKVPESGEARDREQLQVELDLAGEPPWVCRVEVERSLEAGKPLRLEPADRFHVYDLVGAGSSRVLKVPWDANRYRLVLTPVHGKAPRLNGLQVYAATEPSDLGEDLAIAPIAWSRLPSKEAADGERWSLRLEAAERVVGLDLVLAPPAAPLAVQVRRPAGKDLPPTTVFSRGLIWNLPALRSRATRLSLDPTLTDALELELPAGARVETVRVLVRRQVLLFPAEAGAAYFLHLGGEAKLAPGSLAALPASSRGIFARTPLALGTAEPDPDGIPARDAASRQAAESARPWLPWIAGAAVLILALAAWRLLKEKPDPSGGT